MKQSITLVAMIFLLSRAAHLSAQGVVDFTHFLNDHGAAQSVNQILETSDGGYLMVGSMTDTSNDTDYRMVKVDANYQVVFDNFTTPAENTAYETMTAVAEYDGKYYACGQKLTFPESGITRPFIKVYDAITGATLSSNYDLDLPSGPSNYRPNSLIILPGQNRIWIAAVGYSDGIEEPVDIRTSESFIKSYTLNLSPVFGQIRYPMAELTRLIKSDNAVFAFGDSAESGDDQNDCGNTFYTSADVLVDKLGLTFGSFFWQSIRRISGETPDLIVDATVNDNGDFAILGRSLCEYVDGLSGPENVAVSGGAFEPYWLYVGDGDGDFKWAQSIPSADEFSFTNQPIFAIPACGDSDAYLVGNLVSQFAGNLLQLREATQSSVALQGSPIMGTGSFFSPQTVDRRTNGNLLIGGNEFYIDGNFFASLDISLPGTCCTPDTLYVEQNECQPLTYAFEGQFAEDLTYQFTAPPFRDLVTSQPITVNGDEVNVTYEGTGLNSFEYDFSFPGNYELCYPFTTDNPQLNDEGTQGLTTEESNCNFTYCCQTYCIEYQPDNLEGLINCNTCVECLDGYLPAPFACDNFESYDLGSITSDDMAAPWRGINTETIVFDPATNNRYIELNWASLATSLTYETRTGANNTLQTGRYRISSRIKVGDSGAYEVLTVGDGVVPMLTVRFANGIATVHRGSSPFTTFSFGYAIDEWIQFTQVIELGVEEEASVRFFYNKHYLGHLTPFPANTPNIEGVRFSPDIDSPLAIDNLCLYTIPYYDDCFDGGNAVCLPFDERFDNECQASVIGLYAPFEYDLCFSICDYGGTLINRSGGTGLAATVMASDLAPTELFNDPCVIDAYDGNVPLTLYADIHAYVNDGDPRIEVAAFSPDIEARTQTLIYECNCDNNGCSSTCIGNSTETATPGGLYYIVVLSDRLTDYDLFITPDNACNAEAQILRCGNFGNLVLSDTLTVNSNFSTASNDFSIGGLNGTLTLGNCYTGYRTYDGSDRTYQLEIESPVIADFSLSIDAEEASTAGVFIFSSICGENCIDYFDTPIYVDRARLDSIRLGVGTHYVVVDHQGEVNDFELQIICQPDPENIEGGYIIYSVDNDNCPSTGEDDIHTFTWSVASQPGIFTDVSSFRVGFVNELGSGLVESRQFRHPEDNEGQSFFEFELSQYNNIGHEGDRCLFLPGDEILMSVISNSSNNARRYRPIRYATGGEVQNFNIFAPGGSTRVEEVELDTSVYFDIQIDQINFLADGSPVNGFANTDIGGIRVNSNISFTVSEEADWIDLPATMFDDGFNQSVIVELMPNNTNTVRRAQVLITGNSAGGTQFAQVVTVVQYTDCFKFAPELVLNNPINICRGDTAFLQFNTGEVPIEQYEVLIDGEVMPLSELYFTPENDTEVEVALRNRVCNAEAFETLQINVFDRPDFESAPFTSENCSANLSSYTAYFNTSATTVTALNGDLTDSDDPAYLYRATNITAGENLILTLTSGGCEITEEIIAPDCSCPGSDAYPPLSSSSDELQYVCNGGMYPQLTVEMHSGVGVAWFNAQGEVIGSAPTLQTEAAGTYTVRYRSEQFTNCFDENSLTFEIIDLDFIEASPNKEAVCQGEMLTLNAGIISASSALPLRYNWENGASPQENYTPVFPAQTTGWQTIERQISYQGDLCPVTLTDSIYIVPEPTIERLDIDPCSNDTSEYRIQIARSADSIWWNHNGLNVDTLPGSYRINNVPSGEPIQIFARNRAFDGTPCDASLLIEPEYCNCDFTPIVTADQTAYFYCEGEELPLLTVNSFDNNLITWRDASGGVVEPDNRSYQPSAAGSYYVTYQNNQFVDCVSPEPLEITVAPLMDFTAEISTAIPFCQGENESYSFTVNTSGNTPGQPLTYRWQNGAVSGPEFTYSPGPLDTGFQQIQLEISYAADDRCPISVTRGIYIIPQPTIQRLNVDPCYGDPDFYTIQIAAGPDSVWSNTAGVIVEQTDEAYIFDNIPTGQTIEIFASNNAFGRECPPVAAIFGPVSCNCPAELPLPQAVAGETDFYYCTGAEIPELSVVNESGYRVLWTDENANPVGNSESNFRPEEAGTYFAQFQDVDFDVCLSIDQLEFSVVELATIQATLPEQVIICQGEVYSFEPDDLAYSAALPLVYSWQSGINMDEIFNFAPGALDTGSISITLDLSYEGDYCGKRISSEIYVVPRPTILINITEEPCSNDTTVFSLELVSDADSVWLIDEDGIWIDADLVQFADTFTFSGIPVGGAITAIAANTYAGSVCNRAMSLEIVSPNCSCPAILAPYTLEEDEFFSCPGENFATLEFPEPADGLILTFFEVGGSLPLSSGTNDFTPLDTGQYLLRVYSEAVECFGVTIPFSVNYAAPPVAEAGQNRTICVDESINLAGICENCVGSVTGSWSSSDGVSLVNGSGLEATLMATQAGNYTLYLTVMDNAMCPAMDSFALTVTAMPALGVNELESIACFGDSTASIRLEPSGGTPPYTINWPDGTTEEIVTDLPAGIYNVVLQDAVCPLSTTEVVVTQPEPISAVDTFLRDIIDGMDGAISLEIIGGTPDYNYSWFFGNAFAGPSDTFTTITPGDNYSLLITDANGCMADFGYFSIDTVTTTTVNDFAAMDLVTIYPNPTNGRLRIDFSENLPRQLDIELRTSDGKLAKKYRNAQFVNQGTEIDISIYPAGVYLIRLITPDGIYTQSIIKW